MSKNVLVALLGLAPLLMPAQSSAQFSPQVFAYVDANQPSSTYYVPPNRRSGITGDIHIEHNNVGQYALYLGSYAKADGGNFQVNAYGTSDAYCQIALAVDFTVQKSVSVLCFDGQGDLVNSAFTVQYALYGQGWLPEQQVAYATVNPNGTLNTMEGRTYLSAGGIAPLRLGKGSYQFNLNGLFGNETPFVRVTAAGFGPRHCEVVTLLGGYVAVSCFNGDGERADTEFSLSYVNGNTAYGLKEAHAQAAAQTDGTGEDGTGLYTEGDTDVSTPFMRAIRTSVGKQRVFFTHMGSPTTRGIPYAVTNYEASGGYNTSNRCKVKGWTIAADLVAIDVECRNSTTGSFVDEAFSVAYVR